MPSTLVTVAVGLLLGVALLGAALDRRALAVVALAAAVPDLDAIAGVVVPGLSNALLHALWLPAVGAALLRWDSAHRDTSLLRDRYGWRGVRVAWVAVAAYAVAGIGLDLCSPAGVNLLYPVHDRFYALTGRFVLSTSDGVVQTYVTPGGAHLLSSPGTTATHRVASWLNPAPGPDGTVQRRVHLVESGWQAVVVAAAGAALFVRRGGWR